MSPASQKAIPGLYLSVGRAGNSTHAARPRGGMARVAAGSTPSAKASHSAATNTSTRAASSAPARPPAARRGDHLSARARPACPAARGARAERAARGGGRRARRPAVGEAAAVRQGQGSADARHADEGPGAGGEAHPGGGGAHFHLGWPWCFINTPSFPAGGPILPIYKTPRSRAR